jgi:hypothetical protein
VARSVVVVVMNVVAVVMNVVAVVMNVVVVAMKIDSLAIARLIPAKEPLSSAGFLRILPRRSAARGSWQFRSEGAASTKFPGMLTYGKCLCNPRRLNTYAIGAQTSRAE